MLKVLNLNKSYQVDKTKYEVLKNVSLDMEKGSSSPLWGRLAQVKPRS